MKYVHWTERNLNSIVKYLKITIVSFLWLLLRFSLITKHIALKYYQFRWFVKDKTIKIFPIYTKKQTADIFTNHWMKHYFSIWKINHQDGEMLNKVINMKSYIIGIQLAHEQNTVSQFILELWLISFDQLTFRNP